MTSQRWNAFVSVLVFALVLATAGNARAQWGFPLTAGYPSVSSFGHENGTGAAFGTSPFNYGSFGAPVQGGVGQIGFAPNPNNALSFAQRPQATTSFQSVSNAVTLVPGWSGSARRVHRRYPAQPSVPRTVVRR
jgi:hypothetical protein